MNVPIDLYVDVEFSRDVPFKEMEKGKYYPITIRDVKLRGTSIKNLLDVHHIMLLQRRVYFNILNLSEG